MEDKLFEIVHAFNDFYSFLQLKPPDMPLSEYIKPWDREFDQGDEPLQRGQLINVFKEIFDDRARGWMWRNGEHQSTVPHEAKK